MRSLYSFFKYWLSLVAVITILCGVIYVTVQQSLRQGANDPQIQLAEDAAQALGNHQPVEAALSVGLVDIAHSLSPFWIVFNDRGEPQAGNARLHDQLPQVPEGVLTYAREQGENRVTLQPEPGVRSASVIAPVPGGGYVLVGRSLREVEQREAQARTFVELGWLAAVGSSLVLGLLLEIPSRLGRRALGRA